MNPNSISNYARAGEVPVHLALIAVLAVGVSEMGGDFRRIISKVEVTPKKPRAALAKAILVAIRKPSWIWWKDALRHVVVALALHRLARRITREGVMPSTPGMQHVAPQKASVSSRVLRQRTGPNVAESRYARELSALADTYREALAWDVDDLVRMVGTLATQALRVTGSGGSYSLAAFCARLHISADRPSRYGGNAARGGSNPLSQRDGAVVPNRERTQKDIRAAFEASALAETKPTAALCLVCDLPIKGLHERYGYTDLVEAPLRIAPDGFLAVNSLLAVCVLLARAYRAQCSGPLPCRQTLLR